MKPAEFSEEAFEAPLYNQLERGSSLVWSPGRVLEQHLGFDRAIYVVDAAVWQILGHGRAPKGAALAYYHWPWWPIPHPRKSLPDFRLNLFLQAKRSTYWARTPRAAKKKGMSAPCFGFRTTPHQHRALVRLAKKLRKKAQVTYAAPAFHTVADLRRHTRQRSIVPNATFPSVDLLSGHDAWYYAAGGATGVANPEPTFIEDASLETRIERLRQELPESEEPEALLQLASALREFASEAPDEDEIAPEFLNDLLELERLIEAFQVPLVAVAYAEVRLFAALYNLSWMIVAGR